MMTAACKGSSSPDAIGPLTISKRLAGQIFTHRNLVNSLDTLEGHQDTFLYLMSLPHNRPGSCCWSRCKTGTILRIDFGVSVLKVIKGSHWPFMRTASPQKLCCAPEGFVSTHVKTRPSEQRASSRWKAAKLNSDILAFGRVGKWSQSVPRDLACEMRTKKK